MGLNQTQSLTFRNAQGHNFKLTSEVLGQLSSYAQTEKRHREAGGLLLGRYIVDTYDVVVDQITVPAERDLRTRSTFIRGKAGHQEIVDQVWQASNGTCHYLGEWHTHPEQHPAPSCIDVVNWSRLLLHYRIDPDPLYFIIVGTKGIAAWQGRKKHLKLERLLLMTGVE